VGSNFKLDQEMPGGCQANGGRCNHVPLTDLQLSEDGWHLRTVRQTLNFVKMVATSNSPRRDGQSHCCNYSIGIFLHDVKL